MKLTSSMILNASRTATAVAFAAASTLWGAAPAGPTVNLNEPVEVTVTNPVEVTATKPIDVKVTNPVDVKVTNPVDVQGYVEVLNDALKTPFNKRVDGQMQTSLINALVGLPAIPAGKRLVIEAIGVTALVAANTKATAFLSVNAAPNTSASNNLSVPIPLTSQGAFGLTPREHYMALHKVRIVIDPRFHSGAQFNVFRSAVGDVADVTCTIIGYLEDVPATP